MNHDEFAFFNQQLAAMVRDGIPLEGALQRLCAEMRRSPLRDELTKLGHDLAQGVPLREAVHSRQLPDLYRQMLEVGAQSNNLPAVLTMLADHYQKRQIIRTRLKGLMVYPAIVLTAALLLSCFLSYLLSAFLKSTAAVDFIYPSFMHPPDPFIGLWFPPLFLGIIAVALFVVLASPQARRAMRWRLPAFKEASLAQVASALALMLESGVPLDKGLSLVEQLEQGTPAANEVAHWRERLAGGRGKFSEMAEGGRVFPPLFVWMVAQSGENLAAGFQRAAEIFRSRASYRVETLLYSALPCAVLALGLVIVTQIQPVVAAFISFMNITD